MQLLYLYVGVNVIILLFFFVKEISFYLNSVLTNGEVIYSSIKRYESNDADHHYSSDSSSSTVHAKIAFFDSTDHEIISNTNFNGKRELEMGERIDIRYVKKVPSKIKISKTTILFQWSIFWGISTIISLLTFFYFIYAI